MKLPLTSGGFTNQSIIDALKSLVDKPFSGLKLVFIPTAANIETDGKEWLIDDLYRTKQLGFKKIKIADISAIPKNLWLPQLEEADILMFSGGNTFHLMKWIKKTKLNKLLPAMLKNKIWVGVSAGSMIAGNGLSLESDAILYYENIGSLKEYGALGFVNLSIRPHYTSQNFPMVNDEVLEKMAKKIDGPVYVLDDNSAIVVNGDDIKVVSEGKWKRFN